MPLLAGTARADFTPPLGSRMAAFPRRVGAEVEPRRAAGVLDPLMARALVLQSGQKTVALCSVDLCGLRSVSVKRIRTAIGLAEPRLAGTRVLLAASHTHAGAETSFLFGASPDDPEVKAIEEKIAQTVLAASQDLTPVRAAWGRTTLAMNHNRRVLNAAGESIMALEHEAGKTTGPVDPDLHVIRLDTPAGLPRALVFHYTAHALCLGPQNEQYSADYPGRACEILSQSLPGAMPLFMNGAAGNIHPHVCMRPDAQARDIMGQAVADAALQASEAATPIEDPLLAIASDSLRFANRRDSSLEVEVQVDALRLGPLVLGFVPGEFFVEFQLAFKEGLAPHPGTLVGYANGWTGYAPTRGAYDEGGYGVDLAAEDPPQWCRTALPPGAGEKSIERVLALARAIMPTKT